MPNTTIPTLGDNRTDIYRAWAALDKEVGSPYVLIGFIPAEGVYGLDASGDIVRLYNTFSGGVPTYEKATKQQLFEIDDAIQRGLFQIEARPTRRGAISGFKTYVYHQATGRAPIGED